MSKRTLTISPMLSFFGDVYCGWLTYLRKNSSHLLKHKIMHNLLIYEKSCDEKEIILSLKAFHWKIIYFSAIVLCLWTLCENAVKSNDVYFVDFKYYGKDEF